MHKSDKITRDKSYTGPAIDIAIRIGAIALLIAFMSYPWVISNEIGARVYASIFDEDWAHETFSV